MKALTLFALFLFFGRSGALRAEGMADSLFLVKDGKPEAQIVTAENPPRMVKLAAEELRNYVKKITGAELSIDTKKDDKWATHIYVGKSAYTDELGIRDEGLKDGAYRIVSGTNWLVLLGRDKNFIPKEPWARSQSDASSPDELAKWDAITGATWGYAIGGPMGRNHREPGNWWEADERGSLNAVYGFLRDLGVEWYMAGDLGEVVPQMASLELPQVEKVVRPDFGLRDHHQAPFFITSDEDLLWYLRLGLNSGSSDVGMLFHQAHGMREMHTREELKLAHPEYFALREGKRATKENQTCLSSEGLFQEHLKYIRFLFDYYDVPMVGITPEDGAVYCDCPLCKDKATPERGFVGSRSDYVWDYYNRIAKEIYKTHPNKLLSACAYANYVLPPRNIDKLSPNLVVWLVQQRKNYYDPAVRQEDLELRKTWQKKMGPDGKFLVWTHYPFTVPGRPAYATPEYFPHSISEDLKSLKGISVGDFIEVQFKPDTATGLHAQGFNHLNSFVTARLYWDADQNVDALLEKYYTRFYGPASEEMKAFIAYCEANWMYLKKDAEKISQMFALLEKAEKKAPADSVYGKRIALLAEFVDPLKKVRDQLARGHKSTTWLRIADAENPQITVDGKLDEEVWSRRMSGQGDLKDVVTGAAPRMGTSFRMFWTKEALYIGISCDERDMAGGENAVREDENPALRDGDMVQILLETQNHSYYEWVITPEGAKLDADRMGGKENLQWASGAQIAVATGENTWTAELRIPLAGAGHTDPLHNVVAEEPVPTYPWYFNVRRLRVRGEEKELSLFAPIGDGDFYDPTTFAKLHMGIPEEAIREYQKRLSE